MLEDPQLGFASSVTLLDGPLYFQYGSISASVRVQPVVGIIYSFILRANGTEEGRDEIDLEVSYNFYIFCGGVPVVAPVHGFQLLRGI